MKKSSTWVDSRDGDWGALENLLAMYRPRAGSWYKSGGVGQVGNEGVEGLKSISSSSSMGNGDSGDQTDRRGSWVFYTVLPSKRIRFWEGREHHVQPAVSMERQWGVRKRRVVLSAGGRIQE